MNHLGSYVASAPRDFPLIIPALFQAVSDMKKLLLDFNKP